MAVNAAFWAGKNALVTGHAGFKGGWLVDGVTQPHEAGYLRLDCSRARDRMGWHPKLAAETALEWIVEGLRVYRNREDLRQVMASQIARYHSGGS